MSFLSAEWRKLAFANYEIDPALLKKYLPYKTEIDFWNDSCYISLVGFMFLNTKLLGVSVPFHRNFVEVNLRFYVRYKEANEWKRGVVFIKEIVPRPAITLVANTIYGENYQTMKMSHCWEENRDERIVAYTWQLGSIRNSFLIKADLQASVISLNSEIEFITEHYWGYTKVTRGRTFEYEVTHPTWDHYPVRGYEIKVDFGKVYGEAFSDLAAMKPKSVMLAEGSAIKVESKKQL